MKKQMRIAAMILSVLILFSTCGFTAKASAKSNDPYTVKMAFLLFGNPPKDMSLVEDAVSKYVFDKLNVKVKLMPINVSAYTQQLNLMLAGNEQLDIISVPSASLTKVIASGQVLPLDKMLANEGKGIVKAVGKEYLVAGKVNGKTYALSNLRSFASSYGLVLRKDIVEKYKISTKPVKSLNELTNIFKVIKKNEPNLYLVPGNAASSPLGDFGNGRDIVDPLTDGFGVLMNKAKATKVVNWFETKEYADRVKLMRSWNQAGYVLPDSATNQDSQYSLIKAGKAFGYLARTKPGFIGGEEKMCGQSMTLIDVAPATISTANLQTIQWAIARNTRDASSAMKVLNLFYTDPAVANLITYGIEGKHYVKTSLEGQIEYPKGLDGSNHPYQIGVPWEFPNQFITYALKPDTSSIWKETDKFNRSAARSKAFGFAYSPDKIKTEIASVTNVVNQYQKTLESGAVDPGKMLPEFISKLKAAGIGKIMQEKQNQLNTWFLKNK